MTARRFALWALAALPLVWIGLFATRMPLLHLVSGEADLTTAALPSCTKGWVGVSSAWATSPPRPTPPTTRAAISCDSRAVCPASTLGSADTATTVSWMGCRGLRPGFRPAGVRPPIVTP